VTLKCLQSLTGLLIFFPRVIPSARVFNRRSFDAMAGITASRNHIRISREMKEDIRTWLNFLDNFNNYCYFQDLDWHTNVDLQLYTYSAGGAEFGCGQSEVLIGLM
jgi:hypothetical protein